MDYSGAAVAAADLAMRELALFAACGFLLLGAGDLTVDALWIFGRLRRGRADRRGLTDLPAPRRSGRLAVFIPAWDEADVIAAMLDHALRVWDGADCRLYVGCYPNDPATIEAVRSLGDARIRLVCGPTPGPTSKADCLNRLWERMRADEAAEGLRFKAIVLHDAEDVVHSAELRLFESLVEHYDLVQIPVIPLIDPRSRWIGGHYADEFAEAHGKELVVREALGAGLPSAGVGCAIARDALDRLAAAHGVPFDPASLTEDYELGLRLRAGGGRALFARLSAGPGRAPVATRAYFPGTLEAAVNQKARWMAGIALSGWDRLGWGGGLAERWMRLRDRQSLLAAALLLAAYGALVLGAFVLAAESLGAARTPPMAPFLATLLAINSAMLVWRLAMRFAFVARLHGWREGLRAIPRVVASNAIAMLAARRAVARYLGLRRTGLAAWGKTAHVFPHRLPAE